mmetsp:Transcript_73979/g.176069  ORF Transcript_73979/g.176069 Transcript_73979/m.176069 type:complete len:391 (+) Transcript_73979:113-1285(+)
MQRPASEEPPATNTRSDSDEKGLLGAGLPPESASAPASRAGTAKPPAPFSQRFTRTPRKISKAKLAVSAWRSKVHDAIEIRAGNVVDGSRWGHHYIRPASPNLVESSLYSSFDPPEPEMVSVRQVETALESDLLSLRRKYGCEEPSCEAARFTIMLPPSPAPSASSGRSFSARSYRSEPRQPLEERVGSTSRTVALPRYSKQTLAKWFKRIDVDRSGYLTLREFILALRLHRELFEIFAQVYNLDLGPEGSKQQVAKELMLIRRIVNDVDTDRSGEVDWLEFCDFFRRAGLLLEYQIRTELNRTDLCEEFGNSEAQRISSHSPPPAAVSDAAAGRAETPGEKEDGSLDATGTDQIVPLPKLDEAGVSKAESAAAKRARRRSSFGLRSLVA